ncbi:putative MscS family protein YkuT [Jeotgalicoccus aerolatus]|uniref:Small conductance mechanosensitive channel n=1 Tax=Jeotgalicoccus aerolatus TaxID=709510 RepID=A0ABS4HQ44_9STAP|nr:mechanosensitive ion channel family protein [Jeotgalicoccus aerolatus]MBP1953049.1 small conductance mechanosensitive channel [Jeotgalicoccus aerolatus]GGE02055.1 mechanosensitive ion channel protein MscS [Jeotgalicoccus aerolatus]CAD2073077.1 putative MscS family protein YkuT [Jeotgalicoccus aerolatus]
MKFLTLFNTANTEEPLDLTFFEEIYQELTSPELWINIGTSVLVSVILLIAGYILTKIANRLIDNFFKYKSKSRLKGSDKRNQTLINVLQNGVTIFIWFFVVVAVLESFNIPVATLLAGAGVVGLAIGFGAQSLVKDMITGFFIILENQFDKGDFVRVNTSGTTVAEGEMLSLGLRSSRIQGYEGELYMIPNGTINEVVNFSRYNSIAFLDMNFSIQEDLDQVESTIDKYFENHWREEEVLVEQPAILGVQDIQQGEATIRIMLTAQPMEHFGAARRTRKRLKQYLESQGVFVSVPTMDISDFDQTDAEV